jgi:hypothetical protein
MVKKEYLKRENEKFLLGGGEKKNIWNERMRCSRQKVSSKRDFSFPNERSRPFCASADRASKIGHKLLRQMPLVNWQRFRETDYYFSTYSEFCFRFGFRFWSWFSFRFWLRWYLTSLLASFLQFAQSSSVICGQHWGHCRSSRLFSAVQTADHIYRSVYSLFSSD